MTENNDSEDFSKFKEKYEKILDKIIPEEQFDSLSDRRKAIRQAARSVLPNATETKIFVTANVRAWRHFIEMRGAGFADWEIRNLAIIILKILEQESPLLFSDFTIDELPDGTLNPEVAKSPHSIRYTMNIDEMNAINAKAD